MWNNLKDLKVPRCSTQWKPGSLILTLQDLMAFDPQSPVHGDKAEEKKPQDFLVFWKPFSSHRTGNLVNVHEIFWCPTTFFGKSKSCGTIALIILPYTSPTKVWAAKMFLNRWCCVSQYRRAKRPKTSASRLHSSYSLAATWDFKSWQRLQQTFQSPSILFSLFWPLGSFIIDHHWSSFFQLKLRTSPTTTVRPLSLWWSHELLWWLHGWPDVVVDLGRSLEDGEKPRRKGTTCAGFFVGGLKALRVSATFVPGYFISWNIYSSCSAAGIYTFVFAGSEPLDVFFVQ